MFTVSGSVARGLLLGVSFYEVAPEVLLHAVGLDFEVIRNPDARVPYEKYLRLWDEAMARVDDPDFGLHLAEDTPPEAFSVVTRAVLASRTVGQALDNYLRYGRIISDAISCHIDVYGAEALFGFRFDKPPYLIPRQPAEYILAAIWLLTRRIIRVDASLNRVSFQHPRPDDIGEHVRIFGMEPEFNASFNQFVFDSELLEKSCVEADGEQLAHFKSEAEELMSRLPPLCTERSRIRQAIYETIVTGAQPTVALVSERVGMSPGQMTAALRAKEGMTFTREVRALRRELAVLYLETEEWTISDVAFALGFRDVRSFADSFKRWMGKTPAEYRARIRSGSVADTGKDRNAVFPKRG